MVTIDFYTYNGLPNVVNKTLGEAITLQGYFYKSYNELTPNLEIEGEITGNYCYVKEVGKYYFVANKEIINTNITRLTLREDTLKTFADAISNATGTITTSANGNKYLSTRANIYDIRPTVTKYELENAFNEEGQIIMVTLKG